MTTPALALVPEQNEETALVEKANALILEAEAITITDEASYLAATDFAKNVKALEKGIVDFFKDMKEAAHKAHKVITTKEATQLSSVAKAEKIVKGAITGWLVSQEQKRLNDQRAAQKLLDDAAAAKKKLEDDAAAALAATLETQGKPAEAEKVIQQAIQAPPPPREVVTFAPTVQKVAGISSRVVTTVTVTDMPAFIAYIAANPQFANLLTVNQPALNAQQKAMGTMFKMAGVTVSTRTDIAVR